MGNVNLDVNAIVAEHDGKEIVVKDNTKVRVNDVGIVEKKINEIKQPEEDGMIV